MALRLLEITLSVEHLENVSGLIKEFPVIQVKTWQADEATGHMSFLLDSRHAESVSDQLTTHFGASELFRLILFPVEATVPAVIEPDESKTPEHQQVNSGNHELQRISREELYEDIAEASSLTTTYLVMVGLSTVVAAVGLIRGDVAIIIGAMVIAPLLGPNMALSLAVTLGDRALARRSLRATAAGVLTATILSLAIGYAWPVDPLAPEIIARTSPNVGDVVLAIAAGAAGSLAFTTGVPAVVVGVMVAVALLPPLVVGGLLIGGGHWPLAIGALVLLLTNITCINLAAVMTFVLQKVSPRTWWEADRARKNTRIAITMWILMLGLLVSMILFGIVEPEIQ